MDKFSVTTKLGRYIFSNPHNAFLFAIKSKGYIIVDGKPIGWISFVEKYLTSKGV